MSFQIKNLLRETTISKVYNCQFNSNDLDGKFGKILKNRLENTTDLSEKNLIIKEPISPVELRNIAKLNNFKDLICPLYAYSDIKAEYLYGVFEKGPEYTMKEWIDRNPYTSVFFFQFHEFLSSCLDMLEKSNLVYCDWKFDNIMYDSRYDKFKLQSTLVYPTLL